MEAVKSEKCSVWLKKNRRLDAIEIEAPIRNTCEEPISVCTDENGRLVLNVGTGYCTSGEIDVLDVVDWVRRNRPEILGVK